MAMHYVTHAEPVFLRKFFVHIMYVDLHNATLCIKYTYISLLY
jgi:hypothetical protein